MLLGGLRSGELQFKASWAKKVCKTPFQWKKAGHGEHTPVITAMSGSIK
jgi:hypothetical protein